MGALDLDYAHTENSTVQIPTGHPYGHIPCPWKPEFEFESLMNLVKPKFHWINMPMILTLLSIVLTQRVVDNDHQSNHRCNKEAREATQKVQVIVRTKDIVSS